MKDLNIRPETLKLLEENIGKKLLASRLGNDSFNVTPKTQATKAKNNKMGLLPSRVCFSKAQQLLDCAHSNVCDRFFGLFLLLLFVF